MVLAHDGLLAATQFRRPPQRKSPPQDQAATGAGAREVAHSQAGRLIGSGCMGEKQSVSRPGRQHRPKQASSLAPAGLSESTLCEQSSEEVLAEATALNDRSLLMMVNEMRRFVSINPNGYHPQRALEVNFSTDQLPKKCTNQLQQSPPGRGEILYFKLTRLRAIQPQFGDGISPALPPGLLRTRASELPSRSPRSSASSSPPRPGPLTPNSPRSPTA